MRIKAFGGVSLHARVNALVTRTGPFVRREPPGSVTADPLHHQPRPAPHQKPAQSVSR